MKSMPKSNLRNIEKQIIIICTFFFNFFPKILEIDLSKLNNIFLINQFIWELMVTFFFSTSFHSYIYLLMNT